MKRALLYEVLFFYFEIVISEYFPIVFRDN